MSSRSPEEHALWRWLPGLRDLARYDRRWLSRDLAAGLSVAAIALPVGIAYAELAGVPAVTGIYSAIFPLMAYALFGSSRQLMVGPDAATCIMVAATLEPLAAGDPQRYLALVPTLALMAGALYVFAGLLRLGFIANFLSQPILTGYLNGIAAIIVVGQLPKLFGYPGAAQEFLPRLLEFPERLDQSHLPTLGLGLASIAALLILRRVTPAVPAALAVVAGGIAAVAVFGLRQRGVAVTGNVPAGLPQLHLAWFDAATYRSLLEDAAGIVLISFTSGVLTAKSFARRNGYEIDANRELIAFGASNLAAGLAQGFAVTGADSRTAVNDAMGGRTQLVGIVAAVAMLLVLMLLARPLSLVPTSALAAVILVAAVGLFDLSGLRELLRMSRREGMLSIATTAGVLLLGVLPGVVLAVALSLAWLLAMASRPTDAVLGRVPGLKGFHSVADYPEAQTVVGLLLYRFNGNLVFFNVDYFCARLRSAIQCAEAPVVWVVVDAGPINLIDATAAQRVAELHAELAAQGIELGVARAKRQLRRYFNPRWNRALVSNRFPTLKSAVRAFEDALDGGAVSPPLPDTTANRPALRQGGDGRQDEPRVDPTTANDKVTREGGRAMTDLASGQVLNVKELKKISDQSETAKMQEILARRRKEEEEEAKARQDFMQREIKPDGIDRFNTWVKRAAAQGQSELEIMRFHSQYCTDHGRAINNMEEGWPETLTGFAKRLHEAYVQHLAPQGYKIRAQILNYPDGNLGEAGIFISW